MSASLPLALAALAAVLAYGLAIAAARRLAADRPRPRYRRAGSRTPARHLNLPTP
jgi:hypothetical protein